MYNKHAQNTLETYNDCRIKICNNNNWKVLVKYFKMKNGTEKNFLLVIIVILF